MAPSAFYRQTWGDAAPLPPDKLRPTQEIYDLLNTPRNPPSPFELETVHVKGRTMANWKYLPRNYRDFWVAKAKVGGRCAVPCHAMTGPRSITDPPTLCAALPARNSPRRNTSSTKASP